MEPERKRVNELVWMNLLGGSTSSKSKLQREFNAWQGKIGGLKKLDWIVLISGPNSASRKFWEASILGVDALEPCCRRANNMLVNTAFPPPTEATASSPNQDFTP
jgi:hypothetical protein